MTTYKITDEQAFDLLRQASHHTHRKPGRHSEFALSTSGWTIHAHEALDEATISLLLGATRHLFQRGAHSVRTDLTDAASIDSAAVRGLYDAQQHDAPAGTPLHLLAPSQLRPRPAAC